MFRTVQGSKIDIVEYIKEYMKTHPDVQIFIGCDSQNFRYATAYVTAVVLYTPGKGGHVIYEKERVEKEKVRSTRLLNEVWKSVSLANKLLEAGIKRADYIDIDINPNAKYRSSEVFNSAIGIIEAYGYKCRYKTTGQIATCCADYLVRS